MLNKIIAWIALIGFVLLIINITFFSYQEELSVGVYIIIILLFLISTWKKKM